MDKGTTPEIFDNGFLNESIPGIFDQLNEFEQKNMEYEREILMIEDIVALLPEYNRRFEAMRKIDFAKSSPQEKIVHNTNLRQFFQTHQQMESACRSFSESKSPAYQNTIKLLTERRATFQKQLDAFYKMPLSYTIPNVTDVIA